MLWRAVIKPLIDWWNGVTPAEKAIKAAETKKDPTSLSQDHSKGSASLEDQSTVR